MNRLIGNQKRIDLNKNGRIDSEDLKLLRSSMNGASRNERKHVNHNQDYEVRYARKKPYRTGYKGKRYFADGGALDLDFRKFTLNELIKNLPPDVDFMWINKYNSKDYIRRSSKEFSKYSNKNFTISDYGKVELSKGSENLYLDMKVFEASEEAPEVEYVISIYSKDNQNGLKEFSNKLIKKLAFGGMFGGRTYSTGRAYTNDKKHVNHSEEHEVEYIKKHPNAKRHGYGGIKYNVGGSLENHGLKKGDRIIKTIDGGIQEVKDKDGNTVYVNLANGERSATIPLPFKDGGEVTYFVNKDGIRVRSKVEPKEKLSEKEWMAKHSESKEARAYSGGGSVKHVDLFDDYKNQPKKLAEIVDSYQEKAEDGDEDIEQFLKEVESVGYTFDYGLDNEPYALRKKGVKLSQVEGYEDMDDDKDAYFKRGGKVTFKEKANAIAKNFKGKRVEPKYQKEYGKTYDAKEAKEVGKKIAGAQKAKYDSKAEKGIVVSKRGNGSIMLKAKEIRKEGESWKDALKRAGAMLKK